MSRATRAWSLRCGGAVLAFALVSQGPPITGQRAESKLATVLADLARVVRQDVDATAEPAGGRPLDVAGQPASVQDAMQGRQVREQTDPLDYIVDYLYGGRYTSWWIKRTGAPR